MLTRLDSNLYYYNRIFTCDLSNNKYSSNDIIIINKKLIIINLSNLGASFKKIFTSYLANKLFKIVNVL